MKMGKNNDTANSQPTIRDTWHWDRSTLESWQLDSLNRLLAEVLAHNAFYQQKFGRRDLQLTALSELSTLPFTTKEELVASAACSANGLSAHHTYNESAYSRLHRTSGTTGDPLIVLDTAEDWRHWSGTWQHVLEAAEVSPEDRVFLAFSFGPFVGFWSAHQACVDRGATVIPGGGLSSLARLEFMRQTRATVMCCTPSYALHLAEVAGEHAIDLGSLSIRTIIVAGESGGSVPEVRGRIEEQWQARVVDHSGATEIGPWGFGWPDRIGLHIIETSFVAELIPIDDATATTVDGDLHELVLTSLQRTGAPVIRYRTGDAVIAERRQDGACRFLWLPYGVVGRTDRMVTIRGVNVFPSSIDAVVRAFDGVAEYQVDVTRVAALDQVTLQIEGNDSTRAALEQALTVRLGLRIPVKTVPANSLPRSELKSQRWRDLR